MAPGRSPRPAERRPPPRRSRLRPAPPCRGRPSVVQAETSAARQRPKGAADAAPLRSRTAEQIGLGNPGS